MSKVVDEFIDTAKKCFNVCVDNTRIHNGHELWEDYDMIGLPKDLTPEEMLELIEKMNNVVKYYRFYWIDMSTILKESKGATRIMVYSTDTTEWWRFEA